MYVSTTTSVVKWSCVSFRCRWVLAGRARLEWDNIWVPISRLEPLLHVESPSQCKVSSLAFVYEYSQ